LEPGRVYQRRFQTGNTLEPRTKNLVCHSGRGFASEVLASHNRSTPFSSLPQCRELRVLQHPLNGGGFLDTKGLRCYYLTS
jgi:hypothetical protein